jgi:DNA-binding transcriptional MerR regulator
MEAMELRTLKQVAEWLRCPAHRIIHVCESGIFDVEVGAKGRGSVRRFKRNDIYRIRLALELQTLGVSLPQVKPLLVMLEQFFNDPRIARYRKKHKDLAGVIVAVAEPEYPMLALLLPHGEVRLLVPVSRAGRVLYRKVSNSNPVAPLKDPPLSIVLNLNWVVGDLLTNPLTS